MRARELISRAYAEVIQSKTEISPSELTDGLRYLNRMMAKLAAKGIDVGYTALTDVDDVVTAYDSARLGIVKNLALSLWPQYSSQPVNPLISFWADKTLSTLMSISIDSVNVSKFPSTLPIGSGNYNGVLDDRFYADAQGVAYSLQVEK